MSDSIPAHSESSARARPPTLVIPSGSPGGEASASSSSDEPAEEEANHLTRKRKPNIQESSECDEFLWILSGTGVLHLATKAIIHLLCKIPCQVCTSGQAVAVDCARRKSRSHNQVPGSAGVQRVANFDRSPAFSKTGLLCAPGCLGEARLYFSPIVWLPGINPFLTSSCERLILGVPHVLDVCTSAFQV